ncbi:hypothetical protein MPTK1_6g09570 [Marchantia polymorpha subsp. ruderalis]|uniref:Uncharacterized protein n=2 Tax=Marchantia polymorpha TaxID=3197 RepID=A0AAF6BQ98_MARPO|nr:hypothetical protein MARPO_0152s0001 [Marchantia polymorpha]BBN14182.1 hypothetical protein Mp_6g09570 [Marchantia polymorpha subsp. ruderalis]|eukprot:PTQ28883.1 hypothetical protein MARPO_0152s0001 [Marchantia polymorpha]
MLTTATHACLYKVVHVRSCGSFYLFNFKIWIPQPRPWPTASLQALDGRSPVRRKSQNRPKRPDLLERPPELRQCCAA